MPKFPSRDDRGPPSQNQPDPQWTVPPQGFPPSSRGGRGCGFHPLLRDHLTDQYVPQIEVALVLHEPAPQYITIERSFKKP